MSIDPLVSWSAALEIGLDPVDDQHRRLIDLLNDLYRAAVTLQGQSELLRCLDAMTDYTREHFIAEEGLMRLAGWPGFAEHRVAHQAFIDYVAEVRARLAGGSFVSSLEVLRYLRDWLTEHILDKDRAFALWTASR